MSCNNRNSMYNRRGNSAYDQNTGAVGDLPLVNENSIIGRRALLNSDDPNTTVLWPQDPNSTSLAPSTAYPQPLPEPLPGTTTPQPLPEQVDPMPETLAEYIYTPGFLRSKIGELMRVEFLVANNTTDRVGVLSEVGASYIVLDSLETGSRIMCDLYSIKFVTIIGSQLEEAIYGL